MKKLLLLGCFSLLVMGCVKKGEKGDAGMAGLRGPGSFEMLLGPVSSDNFTVTDSRISQAKQITVYLSDGTNLVEMPYFLPASGVNAFFIAAPINSQIQIVNGVEADATSYVIVLIL